MMTMRTALVAGAALGAFALSGISAADAKTTHHHHLVAPKGPSKEELALRSEVDALKSEVHSLETRLDSQAQAQQQTAAQVQATQAQAQAAQTQAMASQAAMQTAEAKILTIPTQVADGVKKATPKPGWEAGTKVGGTMFADISHVVNTADGVHQATPGADYDIKRFYLVVDHKFNSVWSANLTTDFNYDSGPAAATQLYLKKAFLQAKLSDALVIRAGSADLPWVPFVEGIYGNRYVEQTLIDRTKFGTSADWGLHVSGSLLGGLVNYAASAIDGSGYRKPSLGNVNRTGTIDLEGRVNVNYMHFTAAIGGYTGKLGADVTGTPTYHTAQRFNALIAYTGAKIRVGGEYFSATDWSDVKQSNPALTNKSEGVSVFGSYAFAKKFTAFGRYDWVKPKESTAPAENDNYFNVGVAYHPVDIIDLALLYKHDKVVNGVLSTANGSIGGVKTGSYDEIGVFTQVKF